MYPYEIVFGLTLYEICLCAGIIACFAVFSAFADKLRINVKVQKLAVMCGVCAVILGYGSAVLFQAFYNIKTLGEFVINESTGATFYGGLIGGVAVFMLLYFPLGRLIFKSGEHVRAFFDVANSAVCGIALAHAIGRLGCLFAGCCHGHQTDAWYGIEMYGNAGFASYVPTQLFESVFLLFLFAFLTLRVWGRDGYGLPVYLIAYGVWRFAIEHLRGDYRGDTLVEWLTPSQLTAVCMVAIGVGVIFIERAAVKHFERIEAKAVTQAEADDEK